jgi:predicted enzyme related to lactoylglutathione lyase
MTKNKVVFFEIPASNFKKAKEFYEKVFDWKVELWGDEGAMAYTTAVDKIKIRSSPEASTVVFINANPKTTSRRSACKQVLLTRR